MSHVIWTICTLWISREISSALAESEFSRSSYSSYTIRRDIAFTAGRGAAADRGLVMGNIAESRPVFPPLRFPSLFMTQWEMNGFIFFCPRLKWHLVHSLPLSPLMAREYGGTCWPHARDRKRLLFICQQKDA